MREHPGQVVDPGGHRLALGLAVLELGEATQHRNCPTNVQGKRAPGAFCAGFWPRNRM
jgi:hypothetical protein